MTIVCIFFGRANRQHWQTSKTRGGASQTYDVWVEATSPQQLCCSDAFSHRDIAANQNRGRSVTTTNRIPDIGNQPSSIKNLQWRFIASTRAPGVAIWFNVGQWNLANACPWEVQVLNTSNIAEAAPEITSYSNIINCYPNCHAKVSPDARSAAPATQMQPGPTGDQATATTFQRVQVLRLPLKSCVIVWDDLCERWVCEISCVRDELLCEW